jgi:hypothetical protein
MHLRLFSDFSHKHFVTYSQSVPREHRAPLNARIMFTEAFGINNQWARLPLRNAIRTGADDQFEVEARQFGVFKPTACDHC